MRSRILAVLIVWGLIATNSACFGQTNGSPPAKLSESIQLQQLRSPQTHLFSPPELKTHELPTRPEDVITRPDRQAQVFSSRVDSLNNQTSSAIFRRIEKEGSLRPAEQAPTTELGRKVANAFKPEILHVGHVRIYSPLVTAIARKNPLCLLDPMVLGISF